MHCAIAVAAVSIIAYALLILYSIAPYGFNVSSLIRFGTAHAFFDPAALEPGLVVFNDPELGGVGYDGQFYYYVIKDFFMGEEGISNPFRSQRILYPLLSYVLAFGRADLLPYSMPAVNLLAIAISAMLLWRLFDRGDTRAETLALYMLNIGFLIAFFFNVATPLCIGLAVAGAYFYFREMPWPAALMLSLAMLAQENAAIVIAPLCLWLVWQKEWRAAFVIATSMVPWAVWQAILWNKYGMLPMSMSGGHFTIPFVGMISQVASFRLPGGFIGNLREPSVYPFMAFVLALLVVGIGEMKKKPSELNLLLIIHGLAGVCFNQEQIWSSTITSPARALATVFPFIVLCYARERSKGLRFLIAACALLALMGIVRILLLPVHPFYITQ
jgi:hypothetical protein